LIPGNVLLFNFDHLRVSPLLALDVVRLRPIREQSLGLGDEFGPNLIDRFFDVFGAEVDRGVEDYRRRIGLHVSLDVVERHESENGFRIGNVSGRSVVLELHRVALV